MLANKFLLSRSYVVVLSILLDLLDFMQVLKGHIGLGNARFPSGTAGMMSFFSCSFNLLVAYWASLVPREG